MQKRRPSGRRALWQLFPSPWRIRVFLLAADEPRHRNQEKRCKEHAEQGVDPDQGDVKAAEAESDPESAERSVRFQGRVL